MWLYLRPYQLLYHLQWGWGIFSSLIHRPWSDLLLPLLIHCSMASFFDLLIGCCTWLTKKKFIVNGEIYCTSFNTPTPPTRTMTITYFSSPEQVLGSISLCTSNKDIRYNKQTNNGLPVCALNVFKIGLSY